MADYACHVPAPPMKPPSVKPAVTNVQIDYETIKRFDKLVWDVRVIRRTLTGLEVLFIVWAICEFCSCCLKVATLGLL